MSAGEGASELCVRAWSAGGEGAERSAESGPGAAWRLSEWLRVLAIRSARDSRREGKGREGKGRRVSVDPLAEGASAGSGGRVKWRRAAQPSRRQRAKATHSAQSARSASQSRAARGPIPGWTGAQRASPSSSVCLLLQLRPPALPSSTHPFVSRSICSLCPGRERSCWRGSRAPSLRAQMIVENIVL